MKNKKMMVKAFGITALALTLLIGSLAAWGTPSMATQATSIEAANSGRTLVIEEARVRLTLPEGWSEATPANNPDPSQADYYWYGSENWLFFAVNDDDADVWVEAITSAEAAAVRTDLLDQAQFMQIIQSFQVM